MIWNLHKKPLWLSVLLSLTLVIAVLFIFLFSLNWITHHGKTMAIPSVIGKSFESARLLLDNQGFDVEVQDSVYDASLPPLTVIKQFPEADEVVKIHRTVYVTINRSVPPTVEMPSLEGLSFRNAEVILKQFGLAWDTTYRPDFAKNAVLEQQFNGMRIKPGTKISMGSTLTLVLGSGLGNDQIEVPDMSGLTYTEATILLETNGLILNLVLPDADVTDTAEAFVYRQEPEHMTIDGRINHMRRGETIDLFLSVEKPAPKNPALPAEIKNEY